jgi:hypothetical protein
MTTTSLHHAELLADDLNAYDGDNIWEDVIYPSAVYSEVATDAHEHGEGNVVVTVDGIVISRRGELWMVH